MQHDFIDTIWWHSCLKFSVELIYHAFCFKLGFRFWQFSDTVEPRYKEVLGTMKITLLYQVSHYIRVKNRNIKSWDQQITLLY